MTRFIFTLVTFILLLGADFVAQNLIVDPYEGCAVGDLNLDGHLDIVSGPYIFYGPGYIPQAFRSNFIDDDFINANSDHLYDIDRDGLLDIIIGAWGKVSESG